MEWKLLLSPINSERRKPQCQLSENKELETEERDGLIINAIFPWLDCEFKNH